MQVPSNTRVCIAIGKLVVRGLSVVLLHTTSCKLYVCQQMITSRVAFMQPLQHSMIAATAALESLIPIEPIAAALQ